ncbi:hypothetical protein [Nocardia asiatica]|uniref:hypothetical protein n=1 Tax=Nocardia asiatica TaxID=209252 RepID=UPI0005C23E88|nr:hypothetical protein [Nocardia asiatica]
MPTEFTRKSHTLRVPLEANATRLPGRGRPWTVTAGKNDYWHAEAASERAAKDLLTTRLQAFLAVYHAPKVLSFQGHIAVVSVEMSNDSENSPSWREEIIRPDTRQNVTSYFSASDWDEAEAHTRHTLAHLSTDWHDDTSVHNAAAYVTGDWRVRDGEFGAERLYSYAAWQRAAKAAIDSGRSDWHQWATEHAAQYAIPREVAGRDDTATTAALALIATATPPLSDHQPAANTHSDLNSLPIAEVTSTEPSIGLQ